MIIPFQQSESPECSELLQNKSSNLAMMPSLPQQFLTPTSTPQQSHDSMQMIKSNYQQMSEIVSYSQSVFQKLYTKKESMLADFLQQSLQRMSKELVTYNDLTNSQNIERLCEERRVQLEEERVTILKEFLRVSEANFNKKNKNTKLTEEIAEMVDQYQRMDQINDYLVGENIQLKPQLQNLSLRQSSVVFPTQPIPYVSPYSSQYMRGRKSLTSKAKRKSNPKTRYTPFLEKLSGLKSSRNETEITESVLNLPEVRMLMVRILNRR